MVSDTHSSEVHQIAKLDHWLILELVIPDASLIEVPGIEEQGFRVFISYFSHFRDYSWNSSVTFIGLFMLRSTSRAVNTCLLKVSMNVVDVDDGQVQTRFLFRCRKSCSQSSKEQE